MINPVVLKREQWITSMSRLVILNLCRNLSAPRDFCENIELISSKHGSRIHKLTLKSIFNIHAFNKNITATYVKLNMFISSMAEVQVYFDLMPIDINHLPSDAYFLSSLILTPKTPISEVKTIAECWQHNKRCHNL